MTPMADDRAFVRRVSVMEQGWRLPIGEDGVIRRLGAREQTLGIWETNRVHRGERGHDLPQTCSCKGRGTRPAVALEGLREIDPEHRGYESAKPGPGGSVRLMLPTRSN